MDRARLDAALQHAAADRGVRVLAGRVARVDPGSGLAQLRDRDIVADRVVIAVGGGGGPVRGQVRRQLRRRVVALEVRLPGGAVGGLGTRLLIDRAANGWWYALCDGAATHLAYCTDATELRRGRADMVALWRAACRSAADWLPDSIGTATPRVRPRAIGVAAPVQRGRLSLAGDCALAVDPLSGHGVALAVQSALECTDSAYPRWIADTARMHTAAEREIYRSACGPVDGPFWQRCRR